ncbi:ParA family protein [Kaistella sp. PBT33-4]|uniref:ParA family protein n=1 Tax=Kaistella sp. PBT33-4 TaxID=3032000 RepID=UPI0023D7C276|nr:ParA family protein [Kaistella sp. PBT33-4]MDF0720841.1 ParA family protein [Kaistella sp. PBT33-4]
MSTKVISVLTQKGGVGKTTTTIHLAAGFAKKGRKVLVIDFDSQKNLSLGYKLDDDTPYTVVDFLEQKEGLEFTQKGEHNNIYVLAGSEQLESFKLGRYALKESLALLENFFDYVLIDCPPKPLSEGLTLGEVAVCASDYVLSPIKDDEYSLAGITSLIPSLLNLRERQNLNFEYLGFFFNAVLVNSSDFRAYYNDFLENEFTKDYLLRTFIRQDINIKKAIKEGKTIFQIDNKSRASKDYKNLVKELKAKML